MVTRLVGGIDPLVRLLLVAILLATLLPAGEHRPLAQGASSGAIFVLFLLNGLRLPREEVRRGLRHGRFLLPLVLWCFVAMGLAGWALWQAGRGWLPAQVALGLLYLGLLPTTVQSATSYTSLAGGNVAAAVIAAAVLNLIGVFLTAPLFALIAGGQAVDLDWDSIQRIVLILLLPFAVGQALQHRLGPFVRRHPRAIVWLDRLAIALAVYVAFSGAVEQGLWQQMMPADWAVLCSLVGVFLVLGFGGAWSLGGALRLEKRDRIAFFFAGAQKSVAVGVPLAAVLFPPAVAGLLLLPLLTYHLLQLVISAPAAARLNRP